MVYTTFNTAFLILQLKKLGLNGSCVKSGDIEPKNYIFVILNIMPEYI